MVSEVERHRKLDCEHYVDCLDFACQERWESWSCLTCVQMSGRRQQ